MLAPGGILILAGISYIAGGASQTGREVATLGDLSLESAGALFATFGAGFIGAAIPMIILNETDVTVSEGTTAASSAVSPAVASRRALSQRWTSRRPLAVTW